MPGYIRGATAGPKRIEKLTIPVTCSCGANPASAASTVTVPGVRATDVVYASFALGQVTLAIFAAMAVASNSVLVAWINTTGSPVVSQTYDIDFLVFHLD